MPSMRVAFQISSPALSGEGIARCAGDHLRIAHAIAARDEEQARLAMKTVIDTGLARTLAAMERAG